MAYREPGVYLNVVQNSSTVTTTVPEMVPLIIGTAATSVVQSAEMERGTGDTDKLPSTVRIQQSDIISLGFRPGVAYFKMGEGNDYTFDAATSSITWTETGKSKIIEGSVYYLTYKQAVDFTDSDIYTVTSTSQINSLFGEYTYEVQEVSEDGASQTKIVPNNLACGIYLALTNGADKVYALPLPDASSATYQKALSEKAAFQEGIWRIVPMDMPTTNDAFKAIHVEVDNHVRLMSSYDEKQERTAIYSFASDKAVDDSFYESYKAYAFSKNQSRISLVFPNSCDIVLPDIGVVRNAGGQFLAAAYAGLEAGLPGYQPKTRATLANIDRVNNAKLTRQKLNSLAESGIMIIHQPRGDLSVPTIRHQLTTDTTNTATGMNENSIVYIKDYVSKRLRAICENYVGGTNITTDLVTRLRGSLESAVSGMISSGFILDGAVEEPLQDPDRPDTLIVSVRIYVPYPCNYIDITLYVD